MERKPITTIERITAWVGSLSSLVLHTIIFVAFFVLSFSGLLSWNLMFLILTTIVSLEAIYLAIFIQMTVNRHARELEEVSEDVEEIQEDIEEISEDVEDIQEDIDEIQEDVEEISEEDAVGEQTQKVTLETLSRDIQQLLKDLDALKHKQ